MVTKVNDVVAHGEPSADTTAELLRRRGDPTEGSADIDDEWVADNTDYDDVGALAAALVAEETTLQEQGLSPTLRLHPPRGGHDGIKKPVVEGGQLGPHETEEIDDLLEAMR
jgi:large subunit ribosomal protein L30